jgi:hypothetical protein
MENRRLAGLRLAVNLRYHKRVIRPPAFRGSKKALHRGMRSLPRWRRLLNRCPTKWEVYKTKDRIVGTGDSHV